MASPASVRRCCLLPLLCFALMVAPSIQAPAPAPAPDCLTVVFGLSDCLTYVEGNATKPASACCSELSPVIKSTPQCLCTLFNTTLTSSLGVTINTTLALQLPAACNLSTPPVSQCAALGFPVPGPVVSTPAAGSPASPTPSSSMAPSPPSSMAPTAPSSGPSASATPAPSTAEVPASSSAPQGPSSPSPTSASATSPPMAASPPSSAPRLTLPGFVGGTLLLVASLFVQ